MLCSRMVEGGAGGACRKGSVPMCADAERYGLQGMIIIIVRKGSVKHCFQARAGLFS
jgi:hypothetical protein